MPGITKLLLCSLGTSLITLAATSCATAQSGGDDPDPSINPGNGNSSSDAGNNADAGSDSDFRYYFSITTDPWEKSQGRDWGGQLKFDTNIMSKDFVILYMHLTGNYPKAGPHLSTDPSYMRAHLEQLAIDVAAQIPDPNFSGIAILDYESFPAIWDRVWNRASNGPPDAHDEDFRDDWTDHIRSTHSGFDNMSEEEQEQLLRETWEAAVKDLFLNSINKAREVRPHARWGFYGYPYRFYNLRREVPRGVIAYGDGSHNGSRLNDRLQWMWDAVDLIAPSIYARRIVLPPEDQSCDDACTAAQDLEYVENMIREARRVGNGKPVYPFISVYYNTRHDCFDGEELNEANLWSQIMGPAIFGADGAFLWGDVDTRADRDRWQSFLDRRIMPLMAQGFAERGGGSGTNEASDDTSDDNNSQDQQDRFAATTRGKGVVSRTADRPSEPTRSTRISTRRSTRLPSIKYNPSTDRISKPVLTPEELRQAIRRAKTIRDKKHAKAKDD